MMVVLLIVAIYIPVFDLFNKMIKRVSIIVLVRCLMLGLNGILHMGSNDKFDRITKFIYLFSIIWNKIEKFRFETEIEPWS